MTLALVHFRHDVLACVSCIRVYRKGCRVAVLILAVVVCAIYFARPALYLQRCEVNGLLVWAVVGSLCKHLL